MNLDQIEQDYLKAARELAAMPFIYQGDLMTVLCLISTIQLACRHPDFTGPSRKIVEDFARQCQAQIAEGSPALAAGIELGWNSSYDVPVEPAVNLHTDPDRKCRVCGCTSAKACPGGCYWVEENLCSACEPAAHSIITP